MLILGKEYLQKYEENNHDQVKIIFSDVSNLFERDMQRSFRDFRVFLIL